MSSLTNANLRWKETDELLDESGTCGMALHRRLWRAVTRRNQLRSRRLELIAIDAALGEMRDALNHASEAPLLGRLAELEADVERQSLQGPQAALPWASLDKLRSEVGLKPSKKPYGNQ